MGARCFLRPLLFRVQVSVKTGMGHLMRSLALAQAADSCQIPSMFVLSDEGTVAAKSRHDWHFPILSLPAKLSAAAEGEWLAQQAEAADAAAIIFDGYTFAPDVLKACRSKKRCTVLMDDGMTALTDFADLVVNPTGDPSLCLDSKKYCYGPSFRLLRQEFSQMTPKPIHQRNGLALNLGGSDPLNLTTLLLAEISKQLPDLPVRVVTGPAYPYLTELKTCINTLAIPIQHIHNCQDMSEVWANAKLAVSAAGGSQFELGVCQTPAVLLIVADNQREATRQAVDEGWAVSFDCTQQAPVGNIVAKISALLAGDLQQMSDHAKGKYDAQGAMRLLNGIADYQYD